MRGLAVSVVVLAGCARGPTFTPAEPAPDSSAVAAAVSVDGLVKETFELGPSAETPLADYLFVVDGSPSTKKIVDRLRAGFAAVAAEAPFPERARIAVVGTIPGDPGNLASAHPKVDKRSDARFTPGFLAPVDRASIVRWQGLKLPGYNYAGCDAWFGPRDVNADGVPCIVAHTETSKKHGPVEAGLTVLSQLLAGRDAGATGSGGGFFRDGAAVNVIFVSDTHDPGVVPYTKSGKRSKKFDPALLENRPTWEQLRDKAAATHSLASFRLHAIAPEEECVERWYDLGPAYFDAATASGGRSLDICTAEAPEYVAFLRDVAASGDALDRPVVALGHATDDVVSVEIDGVAVPWTWGDGRALVLVDPPEAKVRVDVIYRPAPATSEPGRPQPVAAPPEPSLSEPVAAGPLVASIGTFGPKRVDEGVLRLIAGADAPGDDDTHELVIDLASGRCAATDVYGDERDTIEGSCRVTAVDGAWTAYTVDVDGEELVLQVARVAALTEAERVEWQTGSGSEGWVVAGGGLDRVYVTP